MTWAMAFASVCGGALVIGAFLMTYRWRLDATESREQRNALYLQAETSGDTIQSVVDRLRGDHAPDCTYCSCGRSKATAALRGLGNSSAAQAEYIAREARQLGWKEPT